MAESGSKLSEEEIYEFLKSLNVPVRINDLKSPTREFIVRVFECFTKDLQIDTARHTLRTWESTKHIEEPEIYDDAQLLILLAMSVNQITNPCGLNITIKDIVEPKPKRTKKILHYLLVFWSYYLQKCARFQAIEETFESEKKRSEQLLLENELLDEKYEENVNILKTVEPSKSELLSTVASKEEKCAKLHMQSEALMSDYQELKKKVANLHNQIDETDITIVTAKEKLEELSQLIISSPNRMNIEIQNLKDKIKTEDVKIKEKENEVKDANRKLQMQEESLKEDEKALSSLQNINEEIQHLRDTVKHIVISQQRLDSEEDKVRKLQFDVEQKKEWKSLQNQKSARVVLNTRKQRENLMEVQEVLQSEEARERKAVDFCKAAANDMQNKINIESDNILELNKKKKEAYIKTDERKKQYMSKVKEQRDNFQSDCDQVHKVIKRKFLR